MKITMYELLGLVKDGKELPKKVKVLDVIYEFDDHYGDYFNKSLDRYLFVYMASEEEWKIAYFLNAQVEIIEDEPRDIEVCGSLFTKSEYDNLFRCEEEKKIPEKLFFTHISNYNDQSVVNNNFNNYFKTTQETINEIIDYLKSKGE